MTTVLQLFQQKGLWPWFASSSTQQYNGAGELGEDFAASYGTPIGAIAGGQVIAAHHYPNSIGDQVVIQSGQGTWLYQHLSSNLKVGQTINAGDVVGTENGLPIDQFSTGPHIEVRYASQGTVWQNPVSAFQQAAQAQVGGNTTVATQNQSTASNSATPASGDPWYCFFMPVPGVPGCSAASAINWADIGIRGGLILLGAILLLIAVTKMVSRPSVVIQK